MMALITMLHHAEGLDCASYLLFRSPIEATLILRASCCLFQLTGNIPGFLLRACVIAHCKSTADHGQLLLLLLLLAIARLASSIVSSSRVAVSRTEVVFSRRD